MLDCLVSGSADGTAIIYTVMKGAYVCTINLAESSLDDLRENQKIKPSWIAISPIGFIIIYSEDDFTLRLFSLNGSLINRIEIKERLYCLRLSEDGEYLVSGGDSKRIVVREVRTLKEITNDYNNCNGLNKTKMVLFNQLPPFESIIRYIGYTKHESQLVVGLQNGKIVVIGANVRQIQAAPTMPAAMPIPETDVGDNNQENPQLP